MPVCHPGFRVRPPARSGPFSLQKHTLSPGSWAVCVPERLLLFELDECLHRRESHGLRTHGAGEMLEV
eukprot:4915914-Amphidinium_carterae.1